MPTCSGMGIGVDRLTMFMTGQSTIQEVLFFPQLRPEKASKIDGVEEFGAVGIPDYWVEHLHKMGVLTVEGMRRIVPGKLFNDMCGYNKKNKLGLQNPTVDQIKEWMG